MGVAIASQWAIRKEIKYGALKSLSFKEEKMMRDFSLILQKNAIPSYAVDEFISYLRTYPYEKLLLLSE